MPKLPWRMHAKSVASTLNCQPSEVIFTSCGTESDNLALRGAALAARQQRNANHILITPVEHHAVSHTAEQLAKYYRLRGGVFTRGRFWQGRSGRCRLPVAP